MWCVADDQVEVSLQDGIDRAPIDARALHADMRHPRRLQPVPQGFEVARHRSKRAHLLARSNARRADHKARYDRLLMHVQPTTPLDERSHPRLLLSEGDRDAAGTLETLPRVLPVSEGDKEWYLYAARAGLLFGVANHRRDCQPQHCRRAKARTKRPGPPPFSPVMRARGRWLAVMRDLFPCCRPVPRAPGIFAQTIGIKRIYATESAAEGAIFPVISLFAGNTHRRRRIHACSY